ncbi:MAG: DUF6089 family protein [Flavobacteriales bacterium]|jgi:hypothetical protein|nr:DUF6089 family protein [Flavobacteriales bacterium]
MQITKKIAKIIGSLCILMFLSQDMLAQKHEFGIFGGASGYIGDIGETDGLKSLKTLGTVKGIFYRYNPDYYIAIRTMIAQGDIEADDRLSSDLFKKQRGLHFSSKITEFSVIGEYHFFRYSAYKHRNRFFSTPFIFAGVAGYIFNPQAELNGKTYDLQKLGTEGQLLNEGASSYSLTQLAIPFGVGYKFNFTERWKFSVEFGWRALFTDYLDDASGNYADKTKILASKGTDAAYFSDPTGMGKTGHQRAISTNNDWYFFTGFMFSYNIKQKRIHCPDELQ